MHMEPWLSLAGLAITVAGAIVLALADAWLSRSILVYLDTIEANVEKLAAAVRAGDSHIKVSGIDVTRDRGQNSARALKMLGWVVLSFGLAVQLAARYLIQMAGGS